jgi:hypothetical protein
LAPVRNLVLDTGPLVAMLDRTDPEHQTSREALADFRGELWTTTAVITEAMYLLRRHRMGPRTLLEFSVVSRLRIEGHGNLGALKSAVVLMEKYADTPMDFADATLVLLAHSCKTRQICTLDRRGFSTYRTLDSGRFMVIP